MAAAVTDLEPPRPPPGRRRIPAQVWDAAAEARGLVAAARAAAAETLQRAEVEAEALRTRARADGREEGLASASELLARAAARRDRALAEAEAELVDLAFAVAAAVVGELVTRHREAVVETARRALAAARQRSEVSLRAHPGDVAALRHREAELLEPLVRAGRIAVVPDPQVPPGGVIVESEAGTIDARLETQLVALRRGLTQEGS